jgi:hypothetical protein
MAVNLSALSTRRVLLPSNNIFLLLIIISVRAELTGLVQLEGLGRLKIFIHLTSSRYRDFPACSIVLHTKML